MSTAPARSRKAVREWTVADLQRLLGPIPIGRIRQYLPPGTATENDVLWLNDHEDRLCELVDRILVEKAVEVETQRPKKGQRHREEAQGVIGLSY
jgi:hypothetical protein